MSRFFENAAKILDAAECASQAGTATPMTILIGEEGAIRLVAASDWPLDRLQEHHGARMAYRVSQGPERVEVQGRDGHRSCVFQSETAQAAGRRFLALLGPATALQAVR